MDEKMSEQELEKMVTPKASGTERTEKANSIVKRHIVGSMAAGVILIPGVDALAVVGFQVKMLHSLCSLYGIPFSEKAGRSIISSLVGGLGASAMARASFGSLVKFVPLVGPLAGAVAMPIFAGATTYAVGKIFIRHFEGGGSIFDFSAERVRKDFLDLYKDGRDVASSLKKEKADAEEEAPEQ